MGERDRAVLPKGQAGPPADGDREDAEDVSFAGTVQPVGSGHGGCDLRQVRDAQIQRDRFFHKNGYINTDGYGIPAPFYGCNGEQHDPSAGLQYLRAGYYAPQNGSFTAQDSFAGLLTDVLSGKPLDKDTFSGLAIAIHGWTESTVKLMDYKQIGNKYYRTF